MSRTRRCAAAVEEQLVSLVVAPSTATGFVATATVRRPVGPEHQDPVVALGEGETVARAVGAAEAAAWKALLPPTAPRVDHVADLRQLELAGEEEQ